MKIIVRGYTAKDLPAMVEIWNQVVEDGVAFPQEDALTLDTGRDFFAAQTYNAVAEDADTGTVLGLYILHPNNVGRCGHICNASYAVRRDARGAHIGEKLVTDCLATGQSPRLQGDAVQCRGGLQRPCAAPVRAAGLCAAGHHSGRLPHEGRAL